MLLLVTALPAEGAEEYQCWIQARLDPPLTSEDTVIVSEPMVPTRIRALQDLQARVYGSETSFVGFLPL